MVNTKRAFELIPQRRVGMKHFKQLGVIAMLIFTLVAAQAWADQPQADEQRRVQPPGRKKMQQEGHADYPRHRDEPADYVPCRQTGKYDHRQQEQRKYGVARQAAREKQRQREQ